MCQTVQLLTTVSKYNAIMGVSKQPHPSAELLSDLAVASVAARTAYHPHNSTINATIPIEGRNADMERIENHHTIQSSSKSTAIASDSKPVPDTMLDRHEHERKLEKLQESI